MRSLFLAILCIQAVFLYGEKPTHLKAFVVFDGSGSQLQKYYYLDSKRMEKNLLGIASQTGLIPEIQVYKISKLTRNKVNTWIKTLSPQDVAVFYYAGKETKPRNEKWPILTFPGVGVSKRIGILQSTLAESIQKKNPHLALILLDCYSKVIRISNKTLKLAHTVPLQRTSNDPGLLSLFLESSGVVTACSARPGKPSFGIYQNRPIGGLFTTTVQNYLYAKSATGMPYWGDMLSTLKFDCLYLSHKRQIPFVKKNVVNPCLVPVVPKIDATKVNSGECQ